MFRVKHYILLHLIPNDAPLVWDPDNVHAHLVCWTFSYEKTKAAVIKQFSAGTKRPDVSEKQASWHHHTSTSLCSSCCLQHILTRPSARRCRNRDSLKQVTYMHMSIGVHLFPAAHKIQWVFLFWHNKKITVWDINDCRNRWYLKLLFFNQFISFFFDPLSSTHFCPQDESWMNGSHGSIRKIENCRH